MMECWKPDIRDETPRLFPLILFICIVVLVSFNTAYSTETTDKKSDASVLARIGDEVITHGELKAALNLKRIPQMRLDAYLDAYKDSFLDKLIEDKVFSLEAKKARLDDDPQTKKAIEKVTKETLALHFVEKYIDQKAEPSEEEIERCYSENKEQFVTPEGVLIQHILVKHKEEAEAILKELKEGASFDEMAKKKSIARSWQSGGRLGWLFKGKMDPQREKVVFSLKKGKLSDVIETKEGYQIVKVLDKRDKRKRGFEEAKREIRYRLFWKKKRELVDKLYQDAKVNRDPSEKGVLFRIGDEAFEEEILEPILAEFPEMEREKVKRQWIKYLIETTVFSKEARKVGLEKDLEVANELKIRRDEVLADAFRKRFIDDKLHVNEKEVADYYQSHLEEFKIPPMVRVKTIQVKTKDEAENILKDLKNGTVFEQLATERSAHPSASRVGKLGWFGKGQLDPDLERVAFSLEKGQMSGIIKTEDSFQIIKVIDKTGGEASPLSMVKDEIKMKLIAQQFQEEKQRYYEKAGVKILTPKED